MTKRYEETSASVSMELLFRGIEYEVSKVCDFEIWIKDRYIITVMNDGRIFVSDTLAETCGLTSSKEILYFGLWKEFFEKDDMIKRFLE